MPEGEAPLVSVSQQEPSRETPQVPKGKWELGKTKKPPCSLRRWEIKGVAESRIVLEGRPWSGSIPDRDLNGAETLGLLWVVAEA